MNNNNENADTSDQLPTMDPAAGPEAAVDKPVRRRTRKPVASEDAGPDISAELSTDAGADAPVALEAEAVPAVKRAPRKRKAVAEEEVQPAGEFAPSVEVELDAPADAAVAGAAEGETEAGTDPERRGRNRRRGRDREDRGERAERPPLPAPEELATAVFSEVLSPEWDSEPAPEADADAETGPDVLSGKRVLRPEPEAPKLHKVLAQSGIGSRRDMEQMIVDGHVTVNDEVAHLGMRVTFGDQVRIMGKPVRVRIAPPPARVLAYHKPTGEVVSLSDPEGRPTVFQALPRLSSGKWQSVGRLDINTEGLLLFTTSGELANQLMHPRFGVEREYAVRVLGTLEREQRDGLLAGVEIDGQLAAFKDIQDGGGEGVNHWYRVVITEGRNREVRKLFETVGMAVSRLIRIRYGSMVLPRGLRRGMCVELGDDDIRSLRRLAQPAGGARPPPVAGGEEGAAPRDDNARGRRGRGRGAERGPDRGPDRGADRGPDRGPDRGAERSFERGTDRPSDRAPERAEGFERADRGPRPARPPREERGPRPERPPQAASAPRSEEPRDDEFARIPNPLEQTFDRRFATSGKRGPSQGFGHNAAHRDEERSGGPSGSIPNPLEQTFDRRFAKGSQRINSGFGRPQEEDPDRNPGPRGGPKQPDPMKTSVGYIGADAYFNKTGAKSRGGNRGGSGGGQGGGGGGGFGGGGGGSGPRGGQGGPQRSGGGGQGGRGGRGGGAGGGQRSR